MSKEDIDKIIKTLLKRKMKVYSNERKTIHVFWKDKGKIKFGSIEKDYMHRYGVDTLISLLEGSQNPWFFSNEYASHVDNKIVELIKSDDWENLLDFSIDLLDSIKY